MTENPRIERKQTQFNILLKENQSTQNNNIQLQMIRGITEINQPKNEIQSKPRTINSKSEQG